MALRKGWGGRIQLGRAYLTKLKIGFTSEMPGNSGLKYN